MALSESPVADATLMAIEEINKQGGVLGRQIEPVFVDSRSDPIYAAEQVERLLVDEQVSVIFGCWTSACRRTVKPVVEKYDSLLFYPVQYEGLEESKNIVYTGLTPNQQLLTGVQWAYRFLGETFFLVGSDYVFPRAAHEILKDKIQQLGGDVVGEEYILLGSTEIATVIQAITDSQPDVILNTINGESNFAFFRWLRRAGITPEEIPIISFSIAEAEVKNSNLFDMAGHYAVWSYFQSIDTPANRVFVKAYQERFGADRVTDDPIEAGYYGVYLWMTAVETGGSLNTQSVRQEISGLVFTPPQGNIFVDDDNLHVWKPVRIGQLDASGQFDIVWETNGAIRPEPYPKSRAKTDWDSFLLDLYNDWGGAWTNPGVRSP